MSIETQGRRRAAKYIARTQAKRKVCETCGRMGLKVVKIKGGYGFFCSKCAKVNNDYLDKDVKTDEEIMEEEVLENKMVEQEVKKSLWQRIGFK